VASPFGGEVFSELAANGEVRVAYLRPRKEVVLLFRSPVRVPREGWLSVVVAVVDIVDIFCGYSLLLRDGEYLYLRTPRLPHNAAAHYPTSPHYPTTPHPPYYHDP